MGGTKATPLYLDILCIEDIQFRILAIKEFSLRQKQFRIKQDI